MAKQKSPKGQAGIEVIKGYLRIRLPRLVIDTGAKRYISTGLPNTPENYQEVQVLCWQIDKDIKTGNLDVTLERYKNAFKPKITLSKDKNTDLAVLWELYKNHRKPLVSSVTFKIEYETRIPNLIKKLPSTNIKDAHLIREHLIQTLSKNAVKKTLGYFEACCRWALDQKIIPENYFYGYRRSIRVRKGKKKDPFTQEECNIILEAFRVHHKYSYYYNFVKFLILTGCRTGEAVGLHWYNVILDTKNPYILFTETYSERTHELKPNKNEEIRRFPCNDTLAELLRSIKPSDVNPNQLVFPYHYDGDYINLNFFTNHIWRGTNNNGYVSDGVLKPLLDSGIIERYRPPYNCRHTFITMMLNRHIPVATVAEWVGNTPYVVYKYYAGTDKSLIPPEV